MAKFYGINPQPATRLAVGKFEDEVMIRKNNRILISTIYLDMLDDRWAVAVAYNPSHHPGLHGYDNLLEVRYTYSLKEKMTMKMMRSDPLEEIPIAAGPFSDPDNFVRYVLDHERGIVNHGA
jgi:hypothetical protein